MSVPKKVNKQCILTVDDIPDNLDVINGVLHDEYRLKVALRGEKALTIAESDDPPDLILLDIMMPEMDGYEVCRRLKESSRTKHIPVIFLTAKSEVKDEAMGFALGAVDYITKPISAPLLQARIKTHLALYDQNRVLEEKVRARTAELDETRLEIIRRLGRAAEYKDNETGLHVIRMSHYSRVLAESIGMGRDDAELLLNAAPMHDVGKIGIADRILLKPSKLDDEEWRIMKRHPAFGASIIGSHSSAILKMARVVALTHHEKWNGNGYPMGIAGEEIPLVGRIVAIADVFDALTTARPYKEAWTIERALDLIEREKGEHFDPELVPRFQDSLDEILKIKKRYGESMQSQDTETE